MATPTPVLPVEILGHIIDIVSLEGCSVKDPPLNRFSLVNKTFADLSQRRLFKSIKEVGFCGRSEKCFKRLLWVIERSPHICTYVQRLTFDLQNYEQSTLSQAVITRARTQLAKFSNLQYLAISRPKFGPVFQTVHISNPIISLLHHLANTYISQRTLHNLSVDEVPYILMSQFFTSPIAKSLSFSHNNPFTLDEKYSISRITCLQVSETPTFDLSLLMYLPELERLTLHKLKPITLNASFPGVPSFKLVELSLTLPHPGAAALVVNLIKDRADAAGVPAFGKLFEVEYGFRDLSDVVAFNRILEDGPPIHTLYVEASDYTSPIFPINLIRFGTYFQSASRPMTELYISQRAIPYPDAYTSSLTTVLQILSSIATHNSLSRFEFYLTTQMLHIARPHYNTALWRTIGHVLAPLESFPKLSRVNFEAWFKMERELLRIVEDDIEERDGFRSWMEDAMEDLKDRLGDSLRATMFFQAL
ncbi:hypothetical protein BJ165DRAFT_1519007 [Panaeolus papilionaceus]|nr:hypothetical protein BJ165DRAFT_1519007 [Panaeolus papilionaceus]